MLCLYHKDIELETRLSLKLGICVRTVIGNHQQEVEMVKENRLLLGTSAIIFVLPEQHQRPVSTVCFLFLTTDPLASFDI